MLTEQQQQPPSSESGEKSDESSEKYVIDKPEGDEKSEYDQEDGKRDDSEKVIRSDKKILGVKLPPGWEKHEGLCLCAKQDMGHKILMLLSNLDNGGHYFWHIKSGTIQREMPLWPKELKTPVIPPTRLAFLKKNLSQLRINNFLCFSLVQFPVVMEPTACSLSHSTPFTTIIQSPMAAATMATT